MRPFIAHVIGELLARHRSSGRVELDDIAEVIGERAVSYDEVELIVERLETEGLLVGEPVGEDEVEAIRLVLEKARELRVALGRTPTIAEVAEASAKPPQVVRRALARGLSMRPVRLPC